MGIAAGRKRVIWLGLLLPSIFTTGYRPAAPCRVSSSGDGHPLRQDIRLLCPCSCCVHLTLGSSWNFGM